MDHASRSLWTSAQNVKNTLRTVLILYTTHPSYCPGDLSMNSEGITSTQVSFLSHSPFYHEITVIEITYILQGSSIRLAKLDVACSQSKCSRGRGHGLWVSKTDLDCTVRACHKACVCMSVWALEHACTQAHTHTQYTGTHIYTYSLVKTSSNKNTSSIKKGEKRESQRIFFKDEHLGIQPKVLGLTLAVA